MLTGFLFRPSGATMWVGVAGAVLERLELGKRCAVFGVHTPCVGCAEQRVQLRVPPLWSVDAHTCGSGCQIPAFPISRIQTHALGSLHNTHTTSRQPGLQLSAA